MACTSECLEVTKRQYTVYIHVVCIASIMVCSPSQHLKYRLCRCLISGVEPDSNFDEKAALTTTSLNYSRYVSNDIVAQSASDATSASQ